MNALSGVATQVSQIHSTAQLIDAQMGAYHSTLHLWWGASNALFDHSVGSQAATLG